MDSKIVSSLNDQSNSAVECESISTDKPNATKFISTMGDFVDKQRVHEVIESQQRMLVY